MKRYGILAIICILAVTTCAQGSMVVVPQEKTDTVKKKWKFEINKYW